ncbi:magnesium transporter CorA family protein [Dehalococcoidales bacterium]|nr:magnesium transporter CorA family protein [Dehalococcoidales bacterium]
MTIPQVTEQLNLELLTWGDLTWVNIERPTKQETEYLAQNYPFHHLDLDDCLSRIQRPKIDEYKDYLFLVFHFPVFNKEAKVTTPSQLSVFIGQGYLITLHEGKLKPLVKLFRECQIDEESRQDYFSFGSGYLLYRIIDRLVDYCLPILNKIGENIERTEDDIFTQSGVPSGAPGAIEALSILRRDIISFRRIIWPMRAVIGSLEPKLRHFTKKDLAVYFGDIIDHLDKIWDGLDEYKEIIEGLNATHDSLATNRTNEAMRILTIMGTIMLPLIVISGLWSMNVALPFGGEPGAGPFGGAPEAGGNPYFFIGMLALLVSVAASMLFYFRRKRWI